MSIDLANVQVKHERRIRLFFTNALAASAFTNLSTYAITALTSLGVSPLVVAAFALPGTPNGVELALDADLVGGGVYQVNASGTAAIDASTATPGLATFTMGAEVVITDREQPADDREAMLYFIDIAWDSSIGDMVEGPDGDLATVSGKTNAKGALARRAVGERLAHDPDYGAKARSYVDAPAPALADLRGELVRQFKLDPRVSTASAKVADPSTLTSDVHTGRIDTFVGFVGDAPSKIDPTTIPIPL